MYFYPAYRNIRKRLHEGCIFNSISKATEVIQDNYYIMVLIKSASVSYYDYCQDTMGFFFVVLEKKERYLIDTPLSWSCAVQIWFPCLSAICIAGVKGTFFFFQQKSIHIFLNLWHLIWVYTVYQ